MDKLLLKQMHFFDEILKDGDDEILKAEKDINYSCDLVEDDSIQIQFVVTEKKLTKKQVQTFGDTISKALDYVAMRIDYIKAQKEFIDGEIWTY